MRYGVDHEPPAGAMILDKLLSSPWLRSHCEVIHCDDKEHWLRERKSLVTASDVAMLLGKSPWGTREDLLQRKLDPNFELQPSGPMEFGTRDEDHNRLVFSDLSGISTVGSHQILLRSRKWPHLGATLDGFFFKPVGVDKEYYYCFPENHLGLLEEELVSNMRLPFGCLEMKQTEIYNNKKWGGTKSAVSEYPEHYGIQVHTQLAVSGLDTGLLVCKLGTSRMVVRPIYEDPLLNEEIGEAVEEFWSELEKER